MAEQKKLSCVSTALGLTLNIPFEQAEAWVEPRRNPRHPRRRLEEVFGDEIEIDGHKLVRCVMEPMTVKDFVKAYPVGRYMVQLKQHTFCIINGSVIDFRNPHLAYSNIMAAWRAVE
jgi:hypothetical protein